MNKVLKRILIILVILIGAIIAIPKEENAVTLNELKDKSKLTGENRLIGETFAPPQSWNNTNEIWKNSDGKYFCIDRMSDYGEKNYELAYKFIISYKNNNFYYSFIDFADDTMLRVNENAKKDGDIYYILDQLDKTEYTEDLAKLIYIAKVETENGRLKKGNNGINTGVNYYTPYAYSEQNATWFLLDDHMAPPPGSGPSSDEPNYVKDVFFSYRTYSADSKLVKDDDLHALKVTSHWNAKPINDYGAWDIIERAEGLSKTDLSKYIGEVYVYKSGGGQRIILIEPKDTPPPPEYRPFTLTINKKDDMGNSINGAQFGVSIVNGNGTLLYSNKALTVNGNKSLPFNWEKNEVGNKITVKVWEIKNPSGYTGTYDETKTFTWNGSNWTGSSNTWTVNVTNPRQPFNFSLAKYAATKSGAITGTNLTATFKVTIKGAKYYYKGGHYDTATGDSSNDDTHTWPSVSITGLKSIFTDIEPKGTTVTITVEETKAPDGYTKVNQKQEFVISQTNNKWKVIRRYYYQDSSKYVYIWDSADAEWYNDYKDILFNSTLNIAFCDPPEPKPHPFELKVKKIDTSGNAIISSTAEFNISVTSGNVDKNGNYTPQYSLYSKNDVVVQGSKDIVKKEVNADNDYIEIRIIETKAPYGYIKDSNTYTIRYKWNNSTENWNKIYCSNEKIKRNWNLDTDTLTLSVANPPTTFSFNLQKLMAYGNGTKTTTALSGAKFTLTIKNAIYDKNGGHYNTSVGDNDSNPNDDTHTWVDQAVSDLKLNNIELRDKTTKDIVITIEETYAPPGYTEVNGKYTFTVELNSNGKWKLTQSPTSDLVTVNDTTNKTTKETTINDNETFEVKFYDTPKPFNLGLNKLNGAVDSSRTQKVGALFTVKISNVNKINNSTNNINNNEYSRTGVNINTLNLNNIVPYDRTKDVTITLKETSEPDGYDQTVKNGGDIVIKVKYNSSGNLDISSVTKGTNNKLKDYVYCSSSSNKLTVFIANVPIVSKPTQGNPNATISGKVWLDGQIGDKDGKVPDGKYSNGEQGIEGIQAQVTVRVQRLKPVTKYVNFYTDGAGNWWSNFNKSNATDTDTYKGKTYKPYKSIEYTASYTTNKKEDVSVNTIAYTDENGNYTIDLSSILHSYKIERPFDEYNSTYTGDKTYYEYIADYRVTFTYNGVVYEDTIGPENSNRIVTDSDATEDWDYENISRTDLNKKFATITNNQTGNNNNITLPYTYNKTSEHNSYLVGNSSLPKTPAWDGAWDDKGYVEYQKTAITNKKGTSKGTTYNDFTQVNFTTSSSKQNITNVDLGLVERPADLALLHNVDHTDVSINGKTTEYDYNDIDINLAEEFNKWLEEALSKSENVNLYETDYYYRIADYSDTIKGNKNTLDLMKTTADELDVKVTYKVEMLEQIEVKGENTQIEQIVYYYDSNMYTLDLISDEDGKTYTGTEIDSNIDGYNAILIDGPWDTSTSSSNPKIYITFTVNKDSNGSVKTGEIKNNIAAITTYSTNTGKLDIDSSTKAIVNNDKKIELEDDTVIAKAVNVKVSGEERTISGTVFNDKDKAGNLDEDEAINDVVVQLIEITDNNNEYIWQETKAGSKEVTSVVHLKDKNAVYKYNNGLGDNATGQYKFVNVVPGNYIVRFIYGDGYNYDISVGNTTYNGADYKSTVDSKYTAEWYNTANYADANASKARDNEARRLEVMATTAQIDEGLGTALDVYANNKELKDLNEVERTNITNYLKKLKANNDGELNSGLHSVYGDSYNNVTFDTLDDNIVKALKKCIAYKTFMAAETSKINMPVDTSTLETTESSTGVNYNEKPLDFEGVNFGITTKPAIKLELEKHITALKITPNGTGVQPIVDARVINLDFGDDGITVQGETTGLAIDKSTRGNRGFWQVQTDVEELIQGANLEVEYTYVVTNNGEKDYVSTKLAEAYNQDPEGYSNYINSLNPSELRKNLKGKTNTYGTYLGEYYYTGTKGTGDAEVYSRVEGLEEAVNNQLKYDKATAGEYFDKANEDPVTKNVYNTDGNPGTENINTVVKTTSPTSLLKVGDKDTSKVIKLQSILSSLNTDDTGKIPSYIAEVTKYSSASGGRNTAGTPGNLSYVHSYDNTKTMENSNENEPDEFWGETIRVTKPTGEDRITTMQIAIITVASIATLGVGIVLIKKFAIKK